MFISNAKVKNTLFFDIETTTRYKTYEEYLQNEPEMAKFFEEKSLKRSDYKGMSVDDIYFKYGMLYAEHGQIISIAYRMWDEESRRYTGETIGFKSWEDYQSRDPKCADRDLLIEFNETLYQRFGYNAIDEPKLGSLGGYHILGFDIPFLYKRMLYNGIMSHPSLNTVNQKSWNIKHVVDLKQWTKPADYNGLTSFGMECVLLGIPNPKEDEIDGNQVCFRFWDDHNIDAINKYCMRDVMSSVQMALSISEEGVKKRHQKTMEEWMERQKESDGQG